MEKDNKIEKIITTAVGMGVIHVVRKELTSGIREELKQLHESPKKQREFKRFFVRFWIVFFVIIVLGVVIHELPNNEWRDAVAKSGQQIYFDHNENWTTTQPEIHREDGESDKHFQVRVDNLNAGFEPAMYENDSYNPIAGLIFLSQEMLGTTESVIMGWIVFCISLMLITSGFVIKWATSTSS